MDEEEELERDVDNIISQIKNQSKSLKVIEKERPELKKEDLEAFIIKNASEVVMDSIEMVQSLKLEVMAGADSKMIESVSELVKATTAAIDSLSKLKLAEDKIKSQKELKQMDIEAKTSEGTTESSGLFISREELLKHILTKPTLPSIEDKPPIDV